MKAGLQQLREEEDVGEQRPSTKKIAASPAVNVLESAVPRGSRRHREDRILREHRDDRVDVAALPRVDVRLDDLAHTLVAERAQCLLLAVRRQLLVDALVGALQDTVDSRRRSLERLGDLCRREAEHVAQNQHCPLARGQVLQRGHEREVDALALLVAPLRRGQAVSYGGVRIGLDPDRLNERRGGIVVRVALRALVDR